MTYTDSPGQPAQPYDPQPGPQPPRKKHPLRKWLLIATAVFAAFLGAAAVIGAVAGTAAHNAANPVTSHSAAPAAPQPATQNYDTPTPTPTPSGPDMLTVGQTETLGDSSDAAVGTLTVESAKVTTLPADIAYGERPANGYYVIVHVTAAADPGYTDGWDISEADFYDLTGSRHYDNGNGNSYSALTDYQNAQDLSYTSLGAGEKTDGYLSFDVPSRHGEIVYAPNLDGQPVAEWSY